MKIEIKERIKHQPGALLELLEFVYSLDVSVAAAKLKHAVLAILMMIVMCLFTGLATH